MKVIARVMGPILAFLVFIGSVGAQSTPDSGDSLPQPFANGVGQTATYLDQRGNEVLQFQVIAIERNWSGYDHWSEPQAGSDYVLVTVSVTNIDRRAFVLEPYDFSLVDSLGIAQSRSWASGGADIMEDDTTVEPGETLQFGLVFEVFSDVDPLLFMWQPEYDEYLIIYLGR